MDSPHIFSKFLLTRSSRSVTVFFQICFNLFRISTHTLLAERDEVPADKKADLTISTHTLLAERDNLFQFILPQNEFLLTRSSRSVTCKRCIFWRLGKFLLTRSSRSVTWIKGLEPSRLYISTHTLLAERDNSSVSNAIPPISTHTLLAERDYSVDIAINHDPDFYSHAPRGA